MDATPQAPQPKVLPSPTDMLFSQTQSLAELVEIQKSQQAQIEELQRQNERVIGLLAAPQPAAGATGLAHVKIEDINMPFFAIVGFLVKVSIASIPAILLLSLIYAVVVFVFVSIFGLTLGSVLSF